MTFCENLSYTPWHALHRQRVALEYMILKPNMVEPGRACPEQAMPQQVAQATLVCLRRTVPVPAAMPGINFLSGGQSETTATANLHALNATAEKQPWVLSFSCGRALQASVLQTWRGDDANKSIAQQTLFKRARLNSVAMPGNYTAAMENE